MDYRIFQLYRSLASESLSDLQALRNIAAGKTVYVIGTGPSISRTDLSKLNGEVVIFLNNACRLLHDFRPAQSVCILSDHLRAIELRQEIENWDIPCIATSDKVVNPTVQPGIFSSPFIFVMPKLNNLPDGRVQVSASLGFSDSPTKGLYLGKSVVFPAIQMAHYFGASNISLVGVDMTIGKNAQYYDAGIKSNWSAFSYEKDGRPHFAVMRDCLRERGVVLENLTVGGMVDVLAHNPIRLSLPDTTIGMH